MDISVKQNKLFLFFFLLYVTVFLLLIIVKGFAQENNITVNGYVDAYYSYDTDKNGSSLRQFSPIAPVRDEFRINLAQITGKYSTERVRATVTLHYGDIPRYNWPQSPNDYLQYIQEANAGFSPAKNFWIDAGYFLTHIGAEGVIPISNIAATQALVTYFEPFFQSGVRLSYEFSPKVYGSIHLLNGYNVITDNNKNKSAGIQFGIKPNNKLEIIYNNLIGNEQPNGVKSKVRIYNNLVFKAAAAKNLDILVGADFATQERSKPADSSGMANMYGALLALKYKFHPKFSAYIRGEIINDEEGFITGTFTGANGEISGLKCTGVTLGFEHRPIDNAYIRLEGRMLNADSNLKIFLDNERNSVNRRTEVLIVTGVMF